MSGFSRRQFNRWVALAGGVSLSGCAPWEYAGRSTDPDRLLEDETPTALEWRILNRLGFGARLGEVSQLRAQGVDAWIDQQLEPESIAEDPELLAALERLETLNLSPEDARDRETEWEADGAVGPLVKKLVKYGQPRWLATKPGPVRNELAQATVLRAVFSTRRLDQVMAEFWSDHFNIDQSKGDCRWLKAIDDAQMRKHALGSFRDLLRASAHSPAMLFYLDNPRNRKVNSTLGSRPNENYARELLELHTLGDTSAYTQHDIEDVARALTGWTVEDSRGGSIGQFVFRPEEHDEGEKTILGQRLAPGQGERDGEQVIDLLARHPLTARAIAGKLCYRFLGDVPADLQTRLSQIFLRTDGSIREMLRALFGSDEFRRGGTLLLKRPMHYAVSALRAVGARTSGAGIVNHLDAMGQRPFAWAQPDGYPMAAAPWTAGVLARWNFAIDLVRNRIHETWIQSDSLERAARGRSRAEIAQQLARTVFPEAQAVEVADALATLSDHTNDGLARVLALMLLSPQFQTC